MQAVRLDTVRQTVALWRHLDPADVDKAWPVISQALAQLVARNYTASTALALAYVQQHAAAAGVTVRPLAAPTIDLGRVRTALDVTGPIAVKTAAASGQSAAQASATALVRISGSASRLAQLGGRSTVERTVHGNSTVVGYRRETAGHPCYFCAMLASRGAVYKSERTAGDDHAYHDHCSCTPAPLYAREDDPPDVQELYQRYLDATAGHSGRAAVKAWRAAYEAA